MWNTFSYEWFRVKFREDSWRTRGTVISNCLFYWRAVSHNLFLSVYYWYRLLNKRKRSVSASIHFAVVLAAVNHFCYVQGVIRVETCGLDREPKIETILFRKIVRPIFILFTSQRGQWKPSSQTKFLLDCALSSDWAEDFGRSAFKEKQEKP